MKPLYQILKETEAKQKEQKPLIASLQEENALLKKTANYLARTMDRDDVHEFLFLFNVWEKEQLYRKGIRVKRGDDIYLVIEPHQSSSEALPENSPLLYFKENPENDWAYPFYAKRIVAPVSLLETETGQAMLQHFLFEGLPWKKVDEQTAHLYCNVIREEHQSIVDELSGVITIEDRDSE